MPRNHCTRSSNSIINNINTLIRHKMEDFIDCALTKHISFSLSFPPFLLEALAKPLSRCFFLSDTNQRHRLSPSPSISISLWFFPLSCVSRMGDHSLAVHGENVVDPGHQRADFGVNARVVRLSAALAPGDNTLQLPITHQRTTRVPLGRGEKEKGVYSLHHLIITHNNFYSTFCYSACSRDYLALFNVLGNCVQIPDKHPCPPPGIQRTPCGQ